MDDCVVDSGMPQCLPDEPSRSSSMYEDIVPKAGTVVVQEDRNILHILKDWLEEVVEKWHELIKVLFSKVGMKFPLGRFKKEALEEKCDGAVSDMAEKIREKLNQSDSINAERGVDLQDSREIRDEESTQKMERFKVKTIKLGGVVVQENKKS